MTRCSNLKWKCYRKSFVECCSDESLRGTLLSISTFRIETEDKKKEEISIDDIIVLIEHCANIHGWKMIVLLNAIRIQ